MSYHGKLPGDPAGERGIPMGSPAANQANELGVMKEEGEATDMKVDSCPPARQLFAVKKIKKQSFSSSSAGSKSKSELHGVSIDTVREIRTLMELTASSSSSNVIKLHAVFFDSTASVNLVYTYCSYNLHELIYSPSVKLSKEHVRYICGCMAAGVKTIADHGFCHRDIKPENVLITSSNDVQICDFGLCRPVSAPGCGMSHEAVTVWYKPPEMLLESRYYKNPDVYSLGCTMSEVYSKKVLCPGEEGSLRQLECIFNTLGGMEDWEGFKEMPLAFRGVKWRMDEQYTFDKNGKTVGSVEGEKNVFKPLVYSLYPSKKDEMFLDLVLSCTRTNPSARCSIDEALAHDWWKGDVCKREDLPRLAKEELR